MQDLKCYLSVFEILRWKVIERAIVGTGLS
jgi:hypothetical protein